MNKVRNEVENVKLDEMSMLKNKAVKMEKSLDEKKQSLMESKRQKENEVDRKSKKYLSKVKDVTKRKKGKITKKAKVVGLATLAGMGIIIGHDDTKQKTEPNIKIQEKEDKPDKKTEVIEEKVQENTTTNTTTPDVNTNTQSTQENNGLYSSGYCPDDQKWASSTNQILPDGKGVYKYTDESQNKTAGSDDIAHFEEEIKADKENGNTVNTGDNQYGTTSSSSNQPQPTQEDEDRKQVDLSEYEANDLISEEPPVKEAEEYER